MKIAEIREIAKLQSNGFKSFDLSAGKSCTD